MVRNIIYGFVKGFLGLCTVVGVYSVVVALANASKKDEEEKA